MVLVLQTDEKRQVIDITEHVASRLPNGNGIVSIFTQHTTAAITTADLDPGTDLDLLDAIEDMTPPHQWHHPHNPGHFPDHLWATVIGPGLCVPFDDGQLLLGTWQRIVLFEFDGPRERKIELTVLPALAAN